MAKATVRFDHSPWSRSHKIAPRGDGSWAFTFEVNGTTTDEPVFSPSMKYSAAKKWATAKARELFPNAQNVCVNVLP